MRVAVTDDLGHLASRRTCPLRYVSTGALSVAAGDGAALVLTPGRDRECRIVGMAASVDATRELSEDVLWNVVDNVSAFVTQTTPVCEGDEPIIRTAAQESEADPRALSVALGTAAFSPNNRNTIVTCGEILVGGLPSGGEPLNALGGVPLWTLSGVAFPQYVFPVRFPRNLVIFEQTSGQDMVLSLMYYEVEVIPE